MEKFLKNWKICSNNCEKFLVNVNISDTLEILQDIWEKIFLIVDNFL